MSAGSLPEVQISSSRDISCKSGQFFKAAFKLSIYVVGACHGAGAWSAGQYTVQVRHIHMGAACL